MIWNTRTRLAAWWPRSCFEVVPLVFFNTKTRSSLQKIHNPILAPKSNRRSVEFRAKPPLFHSFLKQGGVFAIENIQIRKGPPLRIFGRRPKIFAVLVFKIVWTTLQKRSKSMIFAKEIVFSKRIISKFSRLRRGYTPQ